MSSMSLMHRKLLLLTLSLACISEYAVAEQQDLTLVVNSTSPSVPFIHFWQSTGFCPPEPHQDAAKFFLGKDMVHNLAYIGAIPHHGILQVRIHWLLDLLKVQGYISGQPVYNFTLLDQLLDVLHVNGLHPGFEIMGSPSGIFTDMENKTQVYMWRDMVHQIAQRYIERYGIETVKQWNFETWNEPDCRDFDEVKMTVDGFLNYYDACSEGLKAASLDLRFGGPGDGCDDVPKHEIGTSPIHGSDYAMALFDHVVNGTNFFNGEKGVRLDFISLHKKGDGKSSIILQKELESMDFIRKHYPSLAQKPFYNDEADPLVGWDKDEIWRATPSYAAMAVKVIAQHQNILRMNPPRSPINYALLSNDNGFLSYYPHQFTQRTLVARFQMNVSNSQGVNYTGCASAAEERIFHREMVRSENYVTFIRKPIYAAMCLLAFLGEWQVPAKIVDTSTQSLLPPDSYAGIMATVHLVTNANTSDSWQMSLLFYSSSDTDVGTKFGKLDFQWYIQLPIASSELMLAVYAVNDIIGNPYVWWADVFGKPDFPTLKQFEFIRENEGPIRVALEPVVLKTGYITLPGLQIREPDIYLFHLCEKSLQPPEQVTQLRLINITAGQLIIVWSDTNIITRCIKTYEVEQSISEAGGHYQRINSEDTIVNIFVFATDSEDSVKGYYRTRAVDYWLRPGEYSNPVYYGSTIG